jgi:hypothetical protein
MMATICGKEKSEQQGPDMTKTEITTGTISFKNGVYTGELRNGIPHGTGIHSCEIHPGESEREKGWMSGLGETAESGDNICAENCQADKKDGNELLFHMANSTIYEGEWRDGMKHGKGVLRRPDGTLKTGIWEDDRFFSAVTEQEHSRSDVPFRNGLYMGRIENGVPHGHGCFTCDDYSYEGEWHHGARHGEGTLRTTKTVYCGTWANDKRHGEGVETATYREYSSTYEGSWKDDLKHGHGTLTTSNGNTYEGGWKDGKRHGHGKEVSTMYGVKTSYIGEWRNNQKNGLGKEVTVLAGMQAEYKGGWKNNHKYGFEDELFSGKDAHGFEDFNVNFSKINLQNGLEN